MTDQNEVNEIVCSFMEGQQEINTTNQEIMKLLTERLDHLEQEIKSIKGGVK